MAKRTKSWIHLFRLLDYSYGDHQLLAKVISCIWGLWLARNAFIFSGKFSRAMDIMDKALEQYHASQMASTTEQHLDTQSDPIVPKWRPPEVGRLLLNTDASFSSTGGGFSFILWDSDGWVLLSGSGPLHDVISMEHAELMAMWTGFQHIRDYWEQTITIASDCKRVVTQLQQKETNFTVLGLVVDKFVSQIRNVPSVSFQYVPRCINGVAHRLAKLGVSLTREALWPFSSHFSVLDDIQTDWLCI